MKKFILSFGLVVGFMLGTMALVANAAPITPVTGGGTGTSTLPSNGYLLIGNGTGYQFIASSSLVASGFTTTTINGTQALVFRIIGDGTSITSTVSGATTTFSLINPGYITTSTFNSTGTPNTFALWNPTGTILASSSPIAASGTAVQIGGNTNNYASFAGSSTYAWSYNDYLNATTTAIFNATSTSIQISTTTGLAASGLVDLDGTEIAYYSSFTSANSSSTLNGMVRALFGSVAVSATGSVYAVAKIEANDSASQSHELMVCSTNILCYWSFQGNDAENSGVPFVFNGSMYVIGSFLANSIRSVSGDYFTNGTNVPMVLMDGTTVTSTWMTLATSGNVGIGVSLPSNKLDVAGSADVIGNLAIGTTTTSTATFNVVGNSAFSATSSFSGAVFVDDLLSSTSTPTFSLGASMGINSSTFMSFSGSGFGRSAIGYDGLNNSLDLQTAASKDIRDYVGGTFLGNGTLAMFIDGQSAKIGWIEIGGGTAPVSPFTVDASSTFKNHLGFATSSVSVSSCGTGSPTVTGSDNVGAILSGTSASSCTLNFAKNWVTAPVCTVSDSNTTAVTDVSAVSSSSVTFSLASALSAVNIYYTCFGNPS